MTCPSGQQKIKFHQLDLTNVESIHRLADHIKKVHGGLDVLINNAAIAFKVIEQNLINLTDKFLCLVK